MPPPYVLHDTALYYSTIDNQLLEPDSTGCLTYLRAKETWQFPGGHLGFRETCFACAAREALEETGLEVLPAYKEPGDRSPAHEGSPLHLNPQSQ